MSLIFVLILLSLLATRLVVVQIVPVAFKETEVDVVEFADTRHGIGWYVSHAGSQAPGYTKIVSVHTLGSVVTADE